MHEQSDKAANKHAKIYEDQVKQEEKSTYVSPFASYVAYHARSHEVVRNYAVSIKS
jgi:hypothetical protein